MRCWQFGRNLCRVLFLAEREQVLERSELSDHLWGHKERVGASRGTNLLQWQGVQGWLLVCDRVTATRCEGVLGGGRGRDMGGGGDEVKEGVKVR